jgi:hypothetical protein
VKLRLLVEEKLVESLVRLGLNHDEEKDPHSLIYQTYQGGTRGSRLCGGDRDRETENSKVCARTRDTRFIQVRTAQVASPTSCLRDQVWRPALGVGLSPEGLGVMRLGTRPSFI